MPSDRSLHPRQNFDDRRGFGEIEPRLVSHLRNRSPPKSLQHERQRRARTHSIGAQDQVWPKVMLRDVTAHGRSITDAPLVEGTFVIIEPNVVPGGLGMSEKKKRAHEHLSSHC